MEKEFAQIPIIRSDPVVSYKEAITYESTKEALAKSKNKHNRLFGTSEPLSEELCALIEKGEISSTDDVKTRGKRLIDEFEWEKNDTYNILKNT